MKLIPDKLKPILRDAKVLWIAARDPRTPRAAKIVMGLAATYALSPIDIIPDFVPLIGWLDDFIIVPIGIRYAMKLIPKDLLAEFRARADNDPSVPDPAGPDGGWEG
jgi:uncharacterized membrane protein YkvA (DUF1232 family)